MKDDKTKMESKEETMAPQESAKSEAGNRRRAEVSAEVFEEQKVRSEKVEGSDQGLDSKEKKADVKNKRSEVKKEKKTTSKNSSLSQKEIDKLILENADLKADLKENKENFLLLAAEFENFKKRINKDQLRSRELYKETMLVGLLPVIDDIDRGLQHHKDDEVAEVLMMIKIKLMAYLENYNIAPFDSLGKEFDPDKHDAMLTRAVEEEKNNIILEEFEKGYMINEKVLRHAKVIVNIIE
ncbi:MAG: nucleotide exchange factor GrpE [Candidatus Neomarinimicrobiota bacterium]|jgi:molecular chaperone GrpE